MSRLETTGYGTEYSGYKANVQLTAERPAEHITSNPILGTTTLQLPSEETTEELTAAREQIRSWLEFLTLRRSFGIDPVFGTVLCAAAAAAASISLAKYPDNEQYTFYAFICSVPTLAICIMRYMRNLNVARQDDLEPGARSGAWIGPLAEAVIRGKRRVRAAAYRMLMRTIPNATSEDIAAMSSSERDCLNLILRQARTGNSELSAAIIRLLERFGRRDAVRTLDEIASGRRWRMRGLRAQAATALAAIRVRDAQSRSESKHPTEGAVFNSDVMATDHAPTAHDVAVQIEELEIKLRALHAAASNIAADSVTHPLIARVEEELQKRSSPSLRLGFLYAGWAVGIPFSILGIIGAASDGDPRTMLAYAAVLAAALILPRWALSRSLLVAAGALAGCDDKRVVGKLAEMLQWPDRALKRSAGRALVRLLPRLQASDKSLLSDPQIQILCDMLRPDNIKYQRPLIDAILRSFEQVGDHNCLPAVERLARMAPTYRAQVEVRARAERCREYLEQRADQSRLSQTLLRAADSGIAGKESLVRAAMSVPTTAPEQLLRAGISTGTQATER